MKYIQEHRLGEVLLFNNKYLYKVKQVKYDLINCYWTYELEEIKTRRYVFVTSWMLENHIVIKDNIGKVLYG